MDTKEVLVIAYACEPNKTSEPGVGWNFSKEISKSYKTTVLTRKNNRNSIENEKLEKIEFIYYDLPFIFQFLKKRMPLGIQFYYLFWQWSAYFFIKKYLKKNDSTIKIVHHLNFGVSWIAPPAFLLNTSFVWGPIGGGDFIPFNFLRRMDFLPFLQESIYYLINKSSKISIVSFLLKKNASAIIFRTANAKKSFLYKGEGALEIISETATSEKIMNQARKHETIANAICVGRMTYWKGFLMAVKGFHHYLKHGGKGKLEIFGEGPEKERIKKYIKDNNLEQSIILRGLVPNTEIKKKMESANVLLHPSFRDGGSWTIMEAMSFGLPVICLNTSGPKDMVTNKCGLLIDIKSPEQVIRDIGIGLLELFNDKKGYEKFSKNAIQRIKTEYNWDKRREQIKQVYDEVLNN